MSQRVAERSGVYFPETTPLVNRRHILLCSVWDLLFCEFPWAKKKLATREGLPVLLLKLVNAAETIFGIPVARRLVVGPYIMISARITLLLWLLSLRTTLIVVALRSLATMASLRDRLTVMVAASIIIAIVV